MSLKNDIKKLAFLQGAQLVAMTRVRSFDEYLAEVKNRLQDTGAGYKDFMNAPMSDMPDSQECCDRPG